MHQVAGMCRGVPRFRAHVAGMCRWGSEIVTQGRAWLDWQTPQLSRQPLCCESRELPRATASAQTVVSCRRVAFHLAGAYNRTGWSN